MSVPLWSAAVTSTSGGWFTDAGDVAAADHIAKWNGTAWSALGTGLNGIVKAIAVSGSDVYVGGWFTDAGDVAVADHIAKWNGTAWSALGTGLNSTVNAIAVGTLYVGGWFTDAGGVAAADYIAKWDVAPEIDVQRPAGTFIADGDPDNVGN